jgi:hypothetical protein
MNTKPNFTSNSWKSLNRLLAPLALALIVSARAETQPAAIPISDIGARATSNYQGDALAVTAIANGARLRCEFQKLEGHATPEGLWLESTKPGGTGKLRLTASALGRAGLSTLNPQLSTVLVTTGKVCVNDKLVRFTRPGLTEEYSVSVDGVRQDFVIESPPLNPQRSTLNQSMGDLRVELALSGARAEAAAGGVRLRLDGSGRALAYSRLRVEDATGRELTARLEVLSADKLAVNVADANATYPVRIDPTFSDCDWVSLGSGVNGCVLALAVSGTNLYAGGQFTTAGGVSATNIAKWDGSAWSALGSGIGGSPPGGDLPCVYALAVSGTNLYAAGCFSMAGGLPANNIAEWDGSTWSPVGSAALTSAHVYALAVSGTNLYAGGYFSMMGGVHAYYIAKWDGSTWSSVGSGMSDSVYTLAVSGTDLYAGGIISWAGSVQPNHIAKWDGSVWSALGSGVGGSNPWVFGLAVSGINLYAAGQFTTAGGVAANGIAKWDGYTWSALGSGVNGPVWALAADEVGHLFVGGWFSLAGTNASPSIAQANVGSPPNGAPAVILASPAGLAVALGATAGFQVAATGTPPLVYQWVFNGTTAIDGATSSVLNLTNVQFSQAGAYSVTVSNLYGAATSAPAVLTVTGVPPVIVASPAGLAVTVGATADFQVEATGSPPLVYQWVFNGTNAIAGATSSVLNLTNVQLTQAGAYSVTVSNLYGAATSAAALLQVFRPGIVVTNCTEASLRSAIAGGRTVTFACDGTITLASTITIPASTVLDGSGHQVTISGGNAVRVFEVPANATLTLVNLTIANGAAYGGLYIDCAGGAIYNSGTGIVDLCTFTGNLASGADGTYEGAFMGGRGLGGAVYNDGTGTLVVKRSTFSGNRVSGGAGAPVYLPRSGWGGDGLGGAIFNGGALWLESSTLQNNGASGGAGGRGYDGHPWMDIATDGGQGLEGGMGAGGALYNGHGFLSSGSGSVINCTFVGDYGQGGAAGAGGTGGTGMVGNGNGGTGGTGGNGFGAVYDAVGGLHLTNCTLAFNWANGGGGGEGGAGGGSGTYNPGFPGSGGSSGDGVGGGINGGFIINTLLATNGGNCSGSVTDGGHNLSSDGTCSFTGIGSMSNTDPKIGPLADNGGPTLTMALLPGSPAIDAGNTSVAPATDQRGFPRPAGLAADIGAFEYGSVMPTIAVSRSGATGLNILASGNPGRSCRLLSSPDLSSWAPIATNQVGSDGTILFYDNYAPGSACRFYRLVIP